MTTGAAQTLLRAYQVRTRSTDPDRRQRPAEPAGRARARAQRACKSLPSRKLPARPFCAPAAVWSMASSAPGLLATGLRQALEVRLRGVPLYYRHALVRVAGDDRVQSAEIAAIDATGRIVEGTRKSFAVDAVCVNYGFLPQNELARALGCNFRFNAQSSSFEAERDNDCRSSVPEVFIVGDAGAMRGARVALAQGALAGAAAAADLGRGPVDVAACEAGAASTRALPERSLAIVRCPRDEHAAGRSGYVDLPLRRDRQANDRGSPGAARHDLRHDQARYATRHGPVPGPLLRDAMLPTLLRQRSQVAVSADDFFAPRAPSKPVAIVALAGDAGPEPAPVDILRTDGRHANICLDPPAGPTAP